MPAACLAEAPSWAAKTGGLGPRVGRHEAYSYDVRLVLAPTWSEINSGQQERLLFLEQVACNWVAPQGDWTYNRCRQEDKVGIAAAQRPGV